MTPDVPQPRDRALARAPEIAFPPLHHVLHEVGPHEMRHGGTGERIVFLVTKNHPERLRVTLAGIAASADRLYVIDSSAGPETRMLCADLNLPQVHYHGAEDQRALIDRFATLQQAMALGFITPLSDDCWDIWSKRNYALLYATLCGFERVLLIDDDVVPPPGLIDETLGLAVRHKVVGAKVRGMPDVSVVGHLSALLGLVSQHFVSGHFLALDVRATAQFFFADVYNEDWLFVLLNAGAHPVARHGAIFQLYWNPYLGSEARAVSEEFGEIIIEGLASAMLAGKGLAPLDNEAHWTEVLARRRHTLGRLGASDLLAAMPACASLVNAIAGAAAAVTPAACLSFWRTYHARLPQWRALTALAAVEGAAR